MQIQDCLAIVSGASRGIGRATALALAQKGARLILLARNPSDLEGLAKKITGQNQKAFVFPVDLSNAPATERVAQEILRVHGVPDILINNAGSGQFLFLEETSPQAMHEMMALPYFAAFMLTRAFLPGMLARKSGRIVNLTSPAAFLPWAGATGYAAARWAMRGFHEALRADLYETGVGSTLVIPSKVRSTYFEKNPGSAERLPGLAKMIPELTPEAVAQSIVTAIERETDQVIIPWMLRLFYFFFWLCPGLIRWPFYQTGWKRKNLIR